MWTRSALRRSPAVRLSSWTCCQVAGLTQTRSPGTASRQTKPATHRSGPKVPLVALRRVAASALSRAVCARTAGVTHT